MMMKKIIEYFYFFLFNFFNLFNPSKIYGIEEIEGL